MSGYELTCPECSRVNSLKMVHHTEVVYDLGAAAHASEPDKPMIAAVLTRDGPRHPTGIRRIFCKFCGWSMQEDTPNTAPMLNSDRTKHLIREVK